MNDLLRYILSVILTTSFFAICYLICAFVNWDINFIEVNALFFRGTTAMVLTLSLFVAFLWKLHEEEN
jgi:hypothetical protein